MKPEIANLTPKAQRTRSALLDATQAELGNRGVAGVTVMAVCERAGVGRSSFYNYFEDAEALVSIVALDAAEDIKGRFDLIHEDVPRGRDRLKACLGMILKAAADEPQVILLTVSLSTSVPEIMELLHKEILAEISEFRVSSKEDQLVLVQYLAQTVLALSRQLALGNFPRHDIDRHVEFMMRACD